MPQGSHPPGEGFGLHLSVESEQSRIGVQISQHQRNTAWAAARKVEVMGVARAGPTIGGKCYP